MVFLPQRVRFSIERQGNRAGGRSPVDEARRIRSSQVIAFVSDDVEEPYN